HLGLNLVRLVGIRELLSFLKIVNNVQKAGQHPGNRVAVNDHVQRIVQRQDKENPDDTEDADAAAGHQHRKNDVSCAAQRAGINLDKSKRRISGSHQPQDSHADIDNLRIGGKQPENKSAKNQQQHA